MSRKPSLSASQRQHTERTSFRESLDATRRIDRELQDLIQKSVADATEILWMDHKKRRTAIHVPTATTGTWRERTVETRVLQAGRLGQHRQGMTTWNEISSAIRQALAQATANPKGAPRFQEQPGTLPTVRGFDRHIARLTEEKAHALLAQHCTPSDAATMDWFDGQILLRNSRGLHLTQRVTSVEVSVRSGCGTGAGFATNAARSLEDLDLAGLFQRARSRRASGSDPRPLENPQAPLVLAPEATAELVEMLNNRAFAAQAYSEGTSFLREHLGVQVFDQRLNLRDDATDPRGLPFPFDLEGRTKKSVLLVEKGIPRTPTLDTTTAHSCGLDATGHGVCIGVGYGLNLIMEPGEATEKELLELADGGVWISRLESIECFDPSRMLVRAHARGVRRIKDGNLQQPIRDLVWEDSLLRIFAEIGGIGRTTARRLSTDGFLGGVCAPAVLVDAAGSLSPASIDPTPINSTSSN